MAAQNFKVKILNISAERKSNPRPNYYIQAEQYVYGVRVLAQDVDTGSYYIFNADNMLMYVTTAAGAAVVTFDNEGTFLTMPKGYCITRNSNEGSSPMLKHNKGDVITIRATVVEKFGEKRLQRVKVI